MFNIISLIHLLFVLYVVLVPFLANTPEILWLHVALLICMLVHWHFNNDVCALTVLEHFLFPETPRNDLFIQRMVGPVYQVQNRDITLLTYTLLFITLFRLMGFPTEQRYYLFTFPRK